MTTPTKVRCPACAGFGVLEKSDPMTKLLAVYTALSEADQNEVLIYARYLRSRRRRENRVKQ